MEIRRIVTGRLEDGSSGIVENQPSRALAPTALGGLDFHLLWATEGGRSLIAPADGANPYWPGPTGTRFLVVRWAPVADGDTAPQPPSQADLDEAERVLPGLMGAFEVDNPGVHTSQSIDYGLCLDGEMWLRLDGDEEARITPGTCVVQRGTRHIWENRSDKPATMLFVLVGTEDVGGL